MLDMYGAHIYLWPDMSYVRSGNKDLMPAVTLLIYGTTYALTVSHLPLLAPPFVVTDTLL